MQYRKENVGQNAPGVVEKYDEAVNIPLASLFGNASVMFTQTFGGLYVLYGCWNQNLAFGRGRCALVDYLFQRGGGGAGISVFHLLLGLLLITRIK